MRISLMNLEQILPSNYSPRKQLKKGGVQYEKLRMSLCEFAYIDSIIWNERTCRVVGVHQRLQVLKDVGIKKRRSLWPIS